MQLEGVLLKQSILQLPDLHYLSFYQYFVDIPPITQIL